MCMYMYSMCAFTNIHVHVHVYTCIYDLRTCITDPQPQLSESRHHLRELESVLTEQNTAVHPYLKSINSLLYQAVMTTKAAVQEQVKPYTVNDHIAPGKKNETQARFYSTSKKPGRKHKTNVLK